MFEIYIYSKRDEGKTVATTEKKRKTKDEEKN